MAIERIVGMLTSYGILAILLTPIQIALGIWLFAQRVPLRESAGRMIAGLAAFYLCSIGSMLLMGLPLGGAAGVYLTRLASFALVLAFCVCCMLVAFDTSIWVALFCCSAGYTVQNFASGLTEFAWVLLARGGVPSTTQGMVARIPLAVVCTAVTYAAAFRVFARPIQARGVIDIEDRSMIVMMAVVILVIIGFDLVVKWLTDDGVPTGIMVLLRLFHGLACVFTLAMEFELLVNRRLEAERDTMEQVLAERERQYEQARDNIAAIDARMHDIRHAVGRLAANDGLSSDELREIVREVAVYDAHMRTGNEALDTALTEQCLRFGQAGASLSCIADGTALSFMVPADTYAMFSTLLGSLAPANTSLVVREALGATSVHLERATPGPTPDALAATRGIVNRYQGTLATIEEDGTFHLNLLFPPCE